MASRLISIPDVIKAPAPARADDQHSVYTRAEYGPPKFAGPLEDLWPVVLTIRRQRDLSTMFNVGVTWVAVTDAGTAKPTEQPQEDVVVKKIRIDELPQVLHPNPPDDPNQYTTWHVVIQNLKAPKHEGAPGGIPSFRLVIRLYDEVWDQLLGRRSEVNFFHTCVRCSDLGLTFTCDLRLKFPTREDSPPFRTPDDVVVETRRQEPEVLKMGRQHKKLLEGLRDAGKIGSFLEEILLPL